MNNFKGHISKVQVSGTMSIVSVTIQENLVWKVIVIETPDTAPYLKVGEKITLLFKETEVILGTGDTANLSIQNRISGTVTQIKKGTLLSNVVVNTTLEEVSATLSTEAMQQLQLKEGLNVTIMVKLNEIMLSEV
ncbi:molybdopterin-binding protein [Maribacter vaceletii]|uniref:Molybdopterin-binding protein n=1 Tax=Maribacter vaceletii TaxID=1206816 RepID=A0A495DT98_9FLAO|nr:TOBE domain-containing protein [Maribacter vaceletii]RKR07875.1 molybdopterin-binding protein [Maribacter vaceletii]